MVITILHFSYAGMVARSQLAVLDHNSGLLSGQAQTKAGNLRYKHQFSKVSGSWVVKKITAEKNRSYATDLVEEVQYLVVNENEIEKPSIEDTPENIALVEKPNKKDTIENATTRFSL